MVSGLILALATLLTLFRTFALSKLGSRLGEIQIWQYDVGSRYGWLLGGLALLGVALYREGATSGLWSLVAVWAVGLLAIWLLPNFLKTFF